MEKKIYANIYQKQNKVYQKQNKSVGRQVYQITLDARLIIHEITQIFPSNSRFHALKYVKSRHYAFPLGGSLI